MKSLAEAKRKNVIIPTIALAIALGAGTLMWNSKRASAESATEVQTMADRLAGKLGIDKNKIQSAMDSIQQDKKSEKQAEVSANLDEAVKDGVITADQKQKILDEQTKLQQEAVEHQQWAKDSGINFSKLKFYGVGLLGVGKGGGAYK